MLYKKILGIWTILDSTNTIWAQFNPPKYDNVKKNVGFYRTFKTEKTETQVKKLQASLMSNRCSLLKFCCCFFEKPLIVYE